MRLIDADAVIEMMRVQAGCESCDTYNGVRCRACPWDDAISVVDDYADNHPAAEVVPIVRGKWESAKHGLYCSVCGHPIEDWEKTPYCPNCGAKME